MKFLIFLLFLIILTTNGYIYADSNICSRLGYTIKKAVLGIERTVEIDAKILDELRIFTSDPITRYPTSLRHEKDTNLTLAARLPWVIWKFLLYDKFDTPRKPEEIKKVWELLADRIRQINNDPSWTKYITDSIFEGVSPPSHLEIIQKLEKYRGYQITEETRLARLKEIEIFTLHEQYLHRPGTPITISKDGRSILLKSNEYKIISESDDYFLINVPKTIILQYAGNWRIDTRKVVEYRATVSEWEKHYSWTCMVTMTEDLVLEDGHHRFLATNQTTIPVRISKNKSNWSVSFHYLGVHADIDTAIRIEKGEIDPYEHFKLHYRDSR